MDYARSNIEHLRGRRSINVVGEESGVGQSWLQRFMNPDKPSGIRKANPEKLALLADYFGVAASSLMHEDLSSAAAGVSQSGRPDFEKMGNAVTVLREYLAVVGDPADWGSDPVLLEISYEIVEEFGQPVTPANVIDLTKRLGQRIREGGIDEQRKVQGASS